MADFKSYVIVLTFSCFNYINSSSLLCNSEFCRTYITESGCTATATHCRINNATHSGLILPSPTTCNCCDYCLPFYLEGEHCSTGGPGTGTTIGRCGDGLTCAVDDTDGETRCTRLTSECHSDQDDYDARELRGEIGALEHRPMCDEKGKYGPVECIPAHTCFCQSEEGKRIFGEALYLGSTTLRHMHCGCSRFHEKIKKNIVPGVPIPVVGPRCTVDGNFNPIQCLNRTCYCVDTVTGVIIEGMDSVDLDHHPITRLDCYNPNLDLFPQYSEGERPYNYTTPCFEEIEERLAMIKQSEEEGYNVDFGGGFHECLPDGTYGRVAMTSTGTKICVDKHGQQIGKYEALSGTTAFETMDCKCAVTAHLMGAATEKPVCCKNGNYRKIQCRRGLCRCVDSDGRQTTRENANVNLLSCFTQDWREC